MDILKADYFVDYDFSVCCKFVSFAFLHFLVVCKPGWKQATLNPVIQVKDILCTPILHNKLDYFFFIHKKTNHLQNNKAN